MPTALVSISWHEFTAAMSREIDRGLGALGSVLKDESREQKAAAEEVDAERVEDEDEQEEGDEKAMLRFEADHGILPALL